MSQSLPRRWARGIPALTVLATMTLLAGPGQAADGVPLYPPGVDSAYSLTSMEHPDLSGPALTFELYGLSDPADGPVVKDQVARTMFWNAATGENRAIGATVPHLPVTADQRQPAVADVPGAGGTRDVYVVWQQRDDPVTGSWDLYLWRGDEQGNPDAGFPRMLVLGPAYSQQTSPDLALAATPAGKHLVVAWVDDRDTAGAAGEIYLLDLTADGDVDGTPDYLEASFDPATAGTRVDPSGDEYFGQHEPAVGSKGVFWLDDRAAGGSGESDVYRADLGVTPWTVGRFWNNSLDQPVTQPRATGQGAAWLGPGIAGGPFEPWVKKVAGAAGIVTTLADPTAFDVTGMRFALTGGHGGATDGDPDIFFFDKATGQNVPVCSVGQAPGNRLRRQQDPTIGTAPGGARVIWADSRQWTNTPGTEVGSLAYELYVALVPTVTGTATRATVRLGQSVTLRAHVTPGFRGYPVRFQRGTRQTFTHAYYLGGRQYAYSGWRTLATKKLTKGSRASWRWTPSRRGTYWVRVWFKGGAKYTDVGARTVPHVGNASAVLKVVVR